MRKRTILIALLTAGMHLAGCTSGEPQMQGVSNVGTNTAAPLESVSETQELATAGRTESRISEQEAKQIALEKVPGAAADDIREFSMDYDDGRLEYDGKIYFGNNEYEFGIDAYTGEIRHWEVEPIYD